MKIEDVLQNIVPDNIFRNKIFSFEEQIRFLPILGALQNIIYSLIFFCNTPLLNSYRVHYSDSNLLFHF